MNTIAVHTEQTRNHGTVTTLVGDLDADTAPGLGHHLDRLEARPDVIDLRFVPFMGAAGITSLLHARQRHQFRVVPSPAVLRILELCGLDGLVGCPADLPAVLQASFGVAVLDASSRYLYLNDALADRHGRSVADHLGERADDLFEAAEGDSAQVIRRVISSGRATDDLVRPKGGERLLEQRSIHPISFGGRDFAVVIQRPLEAVDAA